MLMRLPDMLERPDVLDGCVSGSETVTMTGLDPFPPADALGQALHFLRMSGAFYCRSELTAPWGLTLPVMPDYLWVHVVTRGSVRVVTEEAGEQRVITLNAGDFALVPHGQGHQLDSEAGAPTPYILDLERELVSDRYEILRHGGDGEATMLICGAVRFDHPAARELVGSMPDVIHLEAAESPRLERMYGVVRLLAAEAQELQPGGEAVITRLADILVIQAVRAWIETDPAAQAGWLGALQHPQIGRALALIHEDPARDWSVATLAHELAMSRSAFAARFTQLVGEPVMQYVTRWRMYVAHDLLRRDGVAVAELAGQLGYRSEAAFARAFKRVLGTSPGAVRRLPDPAPIALD
jgi:AraC-like DNA-binding protein